MTNFSKTDSLTNLYTNWFLDYSSYVILERAIPQNLDGLKPVQRRILFSMREMHDGRYHKVANIIGNTMKYHPHGDAAIGDALVKLGQYNFLIDTQGNWGDVRTGDKAAASRYIEARLTPLALEICFNNKLTEFQDSYDGRNKEPITLPVKFPLLLQHGSEGIAVGLSTKIMPHNFNELLKASINILKGKSFKIFPDFRTSCMADFTNYNNGKKGGRIRVRSDISVVDNNTVVILGIPYGVTTSSLIESIVKANELGKIKIKNIEDNTSENVEIIVNLKKDVSPTITIDALYAFTQCEISISPNCCVIQDGKPSFVSVNDVLKYSTDNTVNLLKAELLKLKSELTEKWHSLMLEIIFIENRIYKRIENANTWDNIIEEINVGITPFSTLLERKINNDDIVKLTELKIKKISKYDIEKSKEKLDNIREEIIQVNKNIDNIIDYAIDFFKSLINKYGVLYPRMTKIMTFDNIEVQNVALANKKLYVNKKDGFLGFSLKNDNFVCECSDIDNVILFFSDGKYMVTSVDNKKFVGKNIIHIDKWSKNNSNMVYNIVYRDGLRGYNFVKRFSVLSVIKDRTYDLTNQKDGSKVVYFSANPNSEWEVLDIILKDSSKIRKSQLEYSFEPLAIKGRNSKGNILIKHPIKKINRKELGTSTLGGMKIWIDETVGRLNTNDVGSLLGVFNSGDSIISINSTGYYVLTNYDMSNRYNMNDIKLLAKSDKSLVISALYYHGENKSFYIKRFKIETTTMMKEFKFISESRGSKLHLVSIYNDPIFIFNFRDKKGEKKSREIKVNDFVGIKGWKSLGNKILNLSRLSGFTAKENKLDTENESNKGNNSDNDKESLTLFD